jgi:hypothetical protein
MGTTPKMVLRIAKLDKDKQMQRLFTLLERQENGNYAPAMA